MREKASEEFQNLIRSVIKTNGFVRILQKALLNKERSTNEDGKRVAVYTIANDLAGDWNYSYH